MRNLSILAPLLLVIELCSLGRRPVEALAKAVAIWALSQLLFPSEVPTRPHRKFLAAHIVCYAILLLLHYAPIPGEAWVFNPFRITLIILTPFVIYGPEFGRRARQVPWAVVVAIATGFLPRHIEHFPGRYWNYLQPVFTSAGTAWFRLLGFNVLPPDRCPPAEIPRGALLCTQDFGVSILPPCAGFEGWALFTAAFGVFWLLNWKAISKPRALGLFCGGLLLMSALNVLRLTGFFAIGNLIVGVWNLEFDHETLGKPIHDTMGPVLYAIGMGFYFWYTGKKIAYEKAHPQNRVP